MSGRIIANLKLSTTQKCVGASIPQLLLLFSGAATLAYEVSWSRLVGLYLGNTAVAAAVVLSSLFTGLAVGQLVGGRISHRVRPLMGYGVAEIIAAFFALTVPAMLSSTGGGIALWESSGARIAWCFAVLFPGTAAIGSTFPFVAAYFSQEGGSDRLFTLAYALNTIGGLIGVLVASLILIVSVGVTANICMAAAVSGICGLIACTWDFYGKIHTKTIDRSMTYEQSRVSFFWCLIAAISGFGTIGLEVLYTHLFSLILHNSTYTFGIVTAVFLAGLSSGALLVTFLGNRVSPRNLVLLSMSLGAALVTMSIILFIRSSKLNYFAEGNSFVDYILQVLWFVVLVVFSPSMFLGMALPAALVGAGRDGRTVGRLTSINTLMAAGGALSAGLVLPPLVGLWESFGIFVFLFGVTGAAILYSQERVASAVGIGLLAAFSASLAASGQSLVPISANEELVQRWSTPYGWIDVVRNKKEGSLAIRQNLHYRHGSTGKTSVREYRQGQLPLLLHSNPTDVAFLGLGTGITASPLVVDQDVESATIVELIPEVVEASRLLSSENLGVVDHPKVEIIMDDARHYLARNNQKFDVIVSDLFVPWESRAGYLYTVEFYQSVRSRLKPGGLFCQWLALYQVGPKEFELIADSFAAAFPSVTLWWGQFDERYGILAIIGSDRRLELDSERQASRWNAGGDNPRGVDPELPSWTNLPDLFLGRWPVRPAAILNTDEHPRLEFQAPISQRSNSLLQGKPLLTYFDRVFADLPQDGVKWLGDWAIFDRPLMTKSERQRLNIFGPEAAKGPHATRLP